MHRGINEEVNKRSQNDNSVNNASLIEQRAETTRGQGVSSSSSSLLPTISMPKGGGAIRGIGEKFTANPVTGTGSLNVPIYTSAGRSGFGPQLSLSYDSGSGNGPFGFGWSLSLPSITRKTDKGLPKYDDSQDSDIFILSGSEDLVPVLKKVKKEDGAVEFVLDEETQHGYVVRRYRPRIEGLFARIERWTRADGDTHWRSISKDNILTVYGRDDKSRISDPADASRIFSWLICESYDDKGNAIVYEYVAENGEGVDLSQANEKNRVRTANRYLKRILYGNRRPLLLDISKPSFRKSHTEQITITADLSSAEWMFEVVFDYGNDRHYKERVFSDSFDGTSRDPANWEPFLLGSGPSVSQEDVRLFFSIPGNSTGAVAFGACYRSNNWLLRGDFDIQVDFDISEADVGKGIGEGTGIRQGLLIFRDKPFEANGVSRVSFGNPSDFAALPRKVYAMEIASGTRGFPASSQSTGSLRLVRRGDILSGYYMNESTRGQWELVHSGKSSFGDCDVFVSLAAWSHEGVINIDKDKQAQVAFDNFVINSGTRIEQESSLSPSSLSLTSSHPENSEQHLLVQASAKKVREEEQLGPIRPDPFSMYRAGFEVRTYRRCHRVLMFHHFPDELGSDPYLVRSTEFNYSDLPYSSYSPQQPVLVSNELKHKGSTRFASFIRSVIQSGYVRDESKSVNVLDGIRYLTYIKKSLPPVEFEYSQARISEKIQQIDAASLENLPVGVDNMRYQWVDLDGEGLSGILTQHEGGTWFYKRNVSALPITGEDGKPVTVARFTPIERLKGQPSPGNLATTGQQLMDLSGDGQLDLVQFNGPLAGFFERTTDEKWETFVPFTSLPNISWNDPNLKFIDLTGDGHADILITEDHAFVWYPSLAEQGFEVDDTRKVRQSLDEEEGPQLVFADATHSIYLADMSGDGLTDLVRIRNGEVCYWPNLGHGCFGAKVTMDNAPWFDVPDQFNQRRIRLADIDGSGVTDIIYLGTDGIQIYFNQSGNKWTNLHTISNFPHIDDLSSIQVVDLLGTGTACIVWSSSLLHDSTQPMRYIDLMDGQDEEEEQEEKRTMKERQPKPHLLIGLRNNLGAETKVHYASSTKFYLADKAAGKPWITRLPFPVLVIEKVETYDYISRNLFISRYAYHHGYFDGTEREFRGFGMVEQWDTEEFAAFSASDAFPSGENITTASHVPPVLTKTWFHTGFYLGREHVSNFFAGLLDANDKGEYYREPAWRNDDNEARKHLLDDTVLPAGLTVEEERQACRALKGSMLRQEVYDIDGTDKAQHPYTVTEQNFSLKMLQPRAGNNIPHAVFFTHNREVINYHYERNPVDPRISHSLTLEVDNFGNVLKQVAIGYGRRQPDPELPLQADRDKQTKTLITYTENRYTDTYPNPVVQYDDAYRAPLPCETCSYELTGYTPTGADGRFRLNDFVKPLPEDPASLGHVFDSEINYEVQPTSGKQGRLIKKVRMLYRKNDLTALSSLGKVESLALQGESYELAFTPGLLSQVYQRARDGQPPENLLPTLTSDLLNILGGQGANQGGYLLSQDLKAEGIFPNTDPDHHWWIPSGRVFYSPNNGNIAAQELVHASQHFFLPRCYRDPFGQTSVVNFDAYDLLMVETVDPLNNRITVGERDTAGNLIMPGNDYRMLQPRLMMDSNRNRTAVAFDALGMVVGTAVMGKPPPDRVEGDSLAGFETDLAENAILNHLGDPLIDPQAVLHSATVRLIYDLFAYFRTRDQPNPLPPVVYTLARETHGSNLEPGAQTKIQHSFSYSDGFGREIQKKIQAEPGPLVQGGSVVSPRWVGSGWTIFNNKGKPVRQYEPFFTDTHRFEFARIVGVSPILFYDPVGRVVATLHPNHTYEKIVFHPWRQAIYDMNDTVSANGNETGDPRTDADIQGYVLEYFKIQSDGWQTWHQQRITGTKGIQERSAAEKAQKHANTPTLLYFDTLGRTFLTIIQNRFDREQPRGVIETVEEKYATRVELDIEGNQSEVRDAIVQHGDLEGRIVMRYDYNVVGTPIHQQSMEAAEKWMLNDVMGKPVRIWKNPPRAKADPVQAFEIEYDPLRRPIRSYVKGVDAADFTRKILFERIIYGDQHPRAEVHNLRGKIYLRCDGAGIVSSEQFDFKGNLEYSTRRLTKAYRESSDWTSVNAAIPLDSRTPLTEVSLQAALSLLLENETFSTKTRYDAFNRPVQLIAPRSNQPGSKRKVIQPVYNEVNLLERVHVWLDSPTEPARLLDPAVIRPSLVGVRNIEYNAKGQRLRVDYLNDTSTFYEYDPLTLRLVHVLTVRNAVTFSQDCQQPPPANWPGCQVQNLHYTYDPVGNITYIRDDAQQRIFFRNIRVEPNVEYTYDANYRLIKATGREHLGQVGGAPIPHSYNDASRVGLLHPNNGNAMGTYTEIYVYDAVGNLLEMEHHGSNLAQPGWTRSYKYDETSLIEDGREGTSHKTSNRLSRTEVGTNNPIIERYAYDAMGNMIHMPYLAGAYPYPNLHWDYQDQLRQVDLGGGGTAYYVYDTEGKRVRKVVVKAPGITEERIYLNGFEVFRQSNSYGEFILERETLHIMDDKHRIAIVESSNTDMVDDDPSPQQLIRYQFSNHLGSASLELDDKAQIISYEEYAPYGSTRYQAVRSRLETPKRYRFTGKERDEENGLYYHGARYYAPWLGRWIGCDPKDSVNSYAYGKQNPIFWFDPSGNEDKPWYSRTASAVSSATSSLWSDAVEGSQIITQAISRGADAAGRWVQDRAEEGASSLRRSGHPVLAEGLSAAGVIGATVTSTAAEVVGQTLAAGPNAVLALQSGGESIGRGAARIYLAEETSDVVLGSLEILAGGGSGAQAALTFLPAARPSTPRLPPSGPVPGNVRSRINQAEGTTRFTPRRASGNPVSAGMEHVRKGHTSGNTSDSQFIRDPSEVLSDPRVIRSEPVPLPVQSGQSYVRHVELPTAVGRTRAAQGSRPTNAIRVQTDARGNVITAYPIPGWRAEFNVQMSSTVIQPVQRRTEHRQ
jgi:RHS repeat-associated protein